MRVTAEAPRTGSWSSGGRGTGGAEGEKQGMGPHLRVVGAGGPRWLVFRDCGGLGVTAGGPRPSGRTEVLSTAVPFSRAARGPRVHACACAQARLGVLRSHAILPATVWATSSQAGGQAPVCSSEPRSQGKRWAAEGSKGPGRLPALAAPGQEQERRDLERADPSWRGQGWRRGTPESRLVAQSLQHRPTPCNSRSPGFGQMRGLEAK